MKSRLNILVPITGTEVSLQATEVGIAIARATKAPITALYVSAGQSPRMAPRLRTAVQPREQAEAILREAVEMADRYGIDMRTAVKTDAAVADAKTQIDHLKQRAGTVGQMTQAGTGR